jgi:CD36 family
VNASNSCYNPQPDLVPNLIDLSTGEAMDTVRAIEGAINMGLVNGLLNISLCKFNGPAYVSFPHFYNADTMLLDAFHPDSGRTFFK